MTRSLLLLMDFQNGIAERTGPEPLAAAGRAADAARNAGVPVAFVRVAFREGYPEIGEHSPGFGARRQTDGRLTEGHTSTEIHAALGRRPDEPVVTKRRIGAFTGSDLAVLLRAQRIDRLVLAGISTSGVVLSTVRAAADLDYELVVLSDACADRDPEVHRVLTEKVFPSQARVATVDGWAAELATPVA